MEEIWVNISGYDQYFVSNFGRMKNKRGKILKPSINKNRKGYLQHSLYGDGGKYHTFALHRLVLTSFVGPKPNGLVGCHNDGDKTNCSLANLRWDTPLSNTLDQVKHGKSNRVLTKEIVIEIKNKLSECQLQKDVADCFGIGSDTVSRIKSGKIWGWV